MLFKKDSLFKKSLKVLVFETNEIKQYKGKLFWDKSKKKWFLTFGKEKIPAQETILDKILNNTIIVVREALDKYKIYNPKEFFEKKEERKPIEIDPSDIQEEMIKAEIRRQRIRTALQNLLPIIMMVIGLIGIGIFIAIVWSSTGENIAKIASKLDSTMAKWQNITQTQDILFDKILSLLEEKCKISKPVTLE